VLNIKVDIAVLEHSRLPLATKAIPLLSHAGDDTHFIDVDATRQRQFWC